MTSSARSLAAALVATIALLVVPSSAGATPVDELTPPEDGLRVPEPPVIGLATDERPTVPPNIGGWPSPGPVTAASYVAIDRDSGTVLAARDADRLRSVASTVKMLTALTAHRLEPDLDRVLTAGAEVAGLEGSGVGLTQGESWDLRDLLEGMLVRSGNDAAEVVASQLTPGGREQFLEEMRADAERLGLDGAVIVSPSGLDDRNQLSASHLATVAVELLADPVLAEIVGYDGVRLPDLGGLPNRNELVLEDDTVIGVKTGFTRAAGYSLVAAADRDERVTVAVVLAAADDERRFDEAAALLDHAARFVSMPALTPVEIGCPGRLVTAVPRSTTIVVPVGAQDDVEVAWPPRDCPDRDELVVTPTLERLPLEPVTVEVDTAERTPVADRDAALGRWLASTVQRAMRALPPAEALGVGTVAVGGEVGPTSPEGTVADG